MTDSVQNALIWLALAAGYAAFVWLLASCMGHASDVDYDEDEQ